MVNSSGISIIIPTYNEERALPTLLDSLANRTDLEIIVIDGGSQDRTVETASAMGCIVSSCILGRSKQMHTGATMATKDILLFLHADSLLPINFEQFICIAIETGHIGGAHKITFSPTSLGLRIIEWGSNIRGKYFRSYYGDQGIFVRKDIYFSLDGFPDQELMEDVEFSKRLRELGKTAFLENRIVTSSRRFIKYGILRTILIMQSIKFLYSIGVSPKVLRRLYS